MSGQSWLALYLVGAAVSAPTIVAMGYRYAIGSCPTLAESRALRREQLGVSILFGSLLAVFWPIGLPGMFLMTGFAQYGVFRAKEPE